jgi:hypothetical protein
MTAMTTNATFHRLPGGRVAIVIKGRFHHRALPLMATVGRIHVEGMSMNPSGTIVSGTLPTTPNAGDELVIRYYPEPSVRTGIKYQGQSIV